MNSKLKAKLALKGKSEWKKVLELSINFRSWEERS
jgi:hypothetical protein